MRRRRRREPPEWRFNWRNPDMHVLRRPYVEVMHGMWEKQEQIMSPDQSQELAVETLEAGGDPDWRTDPTYSLRRTSRPTSRST